MLSRQGIKQPEDGGNNVQHNKNDPGKGGGGDGDNGDRGDVTREKNRRGRMKGGTVTTIALSDVDVSMTGCRRKDKRARGSCMHPGG